MVNQGKLDKLDLQEAMENKVVLDQQDLVAQEVLMVNQDCQVLQEKLD